MDNIVCLIIDCREHCYKCSTSAIRNLLSMTDITTCGGVGVWGCGGVGVWGCGGVGVWGCGGGGGARVNKMRSHGSQFISLPIIWAMCLSDHISYMCIAWNNVVYLLSQSVRTSNYMRIQGENGLVTLNKRRENHLLKNTNITTQKPSHLPVFFLILHVLKKYFSTCRLYPRRIAAHFFKFILRLSQCLFCLPTFYLHRIQLNPSWYLIQKYWAQLLRFISLKGKSTTSTPYRTTCTLNRTTGTVCIEQVWMDRIRKSITVKFRLRSPLFTTLMINKFVTYHCVFILLDLTKLMIS